MFPAAPKGDAGHFCLADGQVALQPKTEGGGRLPETRIWD